MKKLLTSILVIATIYTFSGAAFAYQTHEARFIAITADYQPAVIPRPSTLPGPDLTSDSYQAEGTKAADNANNTKSILAFKLLPKATTGMIGFVGMLAFVMLVVSGVRFVTSYGNEEAVGKAKTQAIYAIVGLVIALLAYAIVTIVTNIKFVS